MPPRFVRAAVALLIAPSAALFACAPARGATATTPSLATGSGEPPTLARRIDAERAGYRPVEGRVANAGARIAAGTSFTAWYSGDTLRLVEIVPDPPIASAPVSTRYYYDDGGRLLFFVAEGLRPGDGSTERYELRVPFDARGEPAGAQYTVNGMPSQIRRAELTEIRENGRAFADVARDAAAGGAHAVAGRWFGYEGGFDAAEKLAEDFKRASRFWRKLEGSWLASEALGFGTFVAFLDDRGRLRRLELAYEAPSGVTGTGEYSYDERGTLFFYVGDERRRTRQGGRQSTTRTQLRAAVDARGTVSAARKTVGGRTQPLRPDELEPVLAREAPARRAVGRTAAAASGFQEQ